VLAAADRALARRSPARPVIERWDGHAAERIVAVVCDEARFDVDGAAESLASPARRAAAIPIPLGAS